jgi:hypothetical protein
MDISSDYICSEYDISFDRGNIIMITEKAKQLSDKAIGLRPSPWTTPEKGQNGEKLVMNALRKFLTIVCPQ